MAAGVKFHRWGLGFRQSSFRPITRALRGSTFGVFQRPPLLGHALFPSGFRRQVNPMAQERSSEFLLAVPGIQHRVPRRTALEHTVPQPADSPPAGTPKLFDQVTWTWPGTSRCSAGFPRSSLLADASLPSTGSSGVSSPASTVPSKRCDFLPSLPPRFVAFAWRYLNVHSFFSLRGGRVRRRGLELVTR